MAYWLARDHSCQSQVVCESFIDTLIEVVGKQITSIEIDKFKIPCAAFQAMDAAGQLANLECNSHDKQDRLEKQVDVVDLKDEGADEPTPTKKDTF